MKKIIFFIISVILLSSISVISQPKNIHLSWSSNEKNTTQNTIAITWFNPVENDIVQYGTSSLLLLKQSKGKYSTEMKTFIHKVVLTDLKKNRTYFYRCGNNENGWSEIYSFQTAPKLGSQKKITVGVWGDTQDNEFNTHFEKSETIIDELLKYPLQFSIHMGDIVNDGSVPDKWDRFFSISQRLHAIAPFMPIPGNHDVDNAETSRGFQKPFPVFHELFNLPEDNVNYSFDYGNTHFVGINSGFAKSVEKSGNLLFGKESSEYKWLEKDLAKAKKNKNITWIILYMHYPLYSYGWSHVSGWQERITPLVDKYNVDLCLSGHRHVYERHKAIRNNSVLPQSDNNLYQKPEGTVYITNGTAGGSPQPLGGTNMPSIIFTNSAKMYNYAIMTIQGETLTYDVYNEEGKEIDYFKIVK